MSYTWEIWLEQNLVYQVYRFGYVLFGNYTKTVETETELIHYQFDENAQETGYYVETGREPKAPAEGESVVE